MDLKSYRQNSVLGISDVRDKDLPADLHKSGANFKAGKVDLTVQGAGKPVSYPAPPNYIPGGWLPLIMPKLVDRPMIVRTDSFVDYAGVQPRDFMTAILRPEPDAARPTDDTQTKLHCISVQFSGAFEKSRWYYREDGTLDGVDYPESQRLIRSDEHDITMNFAHKDRTSSGSTRPVAAGQRTGAVCAFSRSEKDARVRCPAAIGYCKALCATKRYGHPSTSRRY